MEKTPAYWEKAKAHLRSADDMMGTLIDRHEEPPLRSKGRVFETLVHAIVGQQISARAAESVWRRFLTQVVEVAPTAVANQTPDALRRTGLSGRKVEYILGLARDAPWIEAHDWSDCSDDDVRARLTSLRGVGPWTAEMVLIFALLRPDIFPMGDIGVIRAIEGLYAEGRRLTRTEVTRISTPWTPYRTVAVWYLWRHLDAEPVEY